MILNFLQIESTASVRFDEVIAGYSESKDRWHNRKSEDLGLSILSLSGPLIGQGLFREAVSSKQKLRGKSAQT